MLADGVDLLNLQAAHASAQVAGHKFGSRGYADAIAAKLRQEDSPRRERSSLHDGTGKPVVPIVVVRSNDAVQNRIDRRGNGFLS